MLNKSMQITLVLLLSIFLVSSASALSATRAFSNNNINVSQTINVTLTVDASGASVYGVDEFIPTGWTITNINEAGSLNNGKISWLFLDNNNRVLSYQATAPSTTGSFTFLGNYTDGSSLFSVSGSKQVNVSQPSSGNSSSPSIKINEFVSDPNGVGDEWIELYNPTSSLVSLDDWTIEDGTASPQSLTGKSISATGYLVLEKNQADFTFALNNGGDIIILRDSSATIIDSVSYGDWSDGSTADNAPVTDNGNSTGRLPNGIDTNSDINDFVTFEAPTKSALNQILNGTTPDQNQTDNNQTAPSNATDDLMVNYLRGKIIIDSSSAPQGTQYLLTVLTGANSGFEFTGSVDLSGTIPAHLQGQGYFDTRDQVQFSTGSDFTISVLNQSGCSTYEGTFINGGNGWFSPESGLAEITCNTPNESPQFVNLSSEQEVAENSSLEFYVNVTDAETSSTELNVTASGSLSSFFNALTRIFSWVPGFDDFTDSPYQLQLTVSDGENSTTQNVTISVSNTNRAPTISQIENKTIDEDTTLEFNITANDEDSEDTLTYSITNQDTSKVTCSITQSGTLLLTPANNFNGDSICEVTVSDSEYNATSQFTISVTEVNDAPTFIDLDTEISGNEGDLITLVVNASDVDSTDTLTITLNDSRFVLKSGSNNTFEWQTTFSDSGIYYVNVTLSDGTTEISQIITVTITDQNEPPVLSLIENITIQEDSGLQEVSQLTATDNDGDNTIDRFEITQQNTNKVTCSITGTSNDKLSVNPSANFNGQAECEVTVYDNTGASDSQTVYITVENVNDAPVIGSISPDYIPKIPEDASFEFQVNYTDIDNTDSEITLNWYKDGVLDKTSTGTDKTYTFQGAGIKSVLNHNITVIVSDGSESDSTSTQIITSNIPLTDKYDGDTTTFVSTMPDSELTCVFLVLEKSGSGKITMIECVDLTNVVDLDRYSEIDTKFIALDSDKFTPFQSKDALLEMFQVSQEKTPAISYSPDFTLNQNLITSDCPDSICTNIDYNQTASLFKFQITGFSSFLAGETKTCAQQSGDLCSSAEFCPGTSLEAKEAGICCSTSCLLTPPNFSDIDTCPADKLSDLVSIEFRDPDSNDDFEISEIIESKIRIRNNDVEDYDFDIDLHLYNTDDDVSEEHESDDVDVDSGDTETIDIDMDVPEDLNEKDDYVLYVKAEDSNVCTETFISIDIERPDEKVEITRFDITSSNLVCGDISEARITVENKGSEDQDVTIRLESDTLRINRESRSFELEEYDEDDKEVINLAFTIPEDSKPGEHEIRAIASYSGEEYISTRKVFVGSCLPQNIVINGGLQDLSSDRIILGQETIRTQDRRSVSSGSFFDFLSGYVVVYVGPLEEMPLAFWVLVVANLVLVAGIAVIWLRKW